MRGGEDVSGFDGGAAAATSSIDGGAFVNDKARGWR